MNRESDSGGSLLALLGLAVAGVFAVVLILALAHVVIWIIKWAVIVIVAGAVVWLVFRVLGSRR